MSTTTRSTPRSSASTSTPVSTRSGVAPRTRSTNRRPCSRPRDSFLPPITCVRNTYRIAARAGTGFSTPIRGQHVVGRHDRAPRPSSSPHTSSRASVLPATTIGTRTPRRGEPSGVVEQHLGVAAVGAADQQDHVRPCRSKLADRGRRQLAGRDMDDPGAGRQPDAVAGLRGHERLIADDGQSQPPAGARTQPDIA